MKKIRVRFLAIILIVLFTPPGTALTAGSGGDDDPYEPAGYDETYEDGSDGIFGTPPESRDHDALPDTAPLETASETENPDFLIREAGIDPVPDPILEERLTPEERAFFAEFKTGIYIQYRKDLEQKLEHTLHDVQKLGEVAYGLDPDSEETVELFRLLLSTRRKFRKSAKWTLAFMLSGMLDTPASSGIFFGLSPEAYPRHVMFELADLQLEAAFLRKKLASTEKAIQMFRSEADRLNDASED